MTQSVLAKPVLAKPTKKSASLEVKPAYVEMVLKKPLEEKDIELTFINHSQDTLKLEIFPIDFKQQDPTGLLSFLGKEASQWYSYSLSSFLSFETNLLLLNPGEEKIFTIKAINREDLSPGGHYAAVVARIISRPQAKRNTSVLSPAVSSLILLRKTGGEKFNLSLLEVDWPKGMFAFNYHKVMELTFQNRGNVHLVPYGRVEIRDIFNRLLYKGVINVNSTRVFPESRRYIEARLKKINPSFPLSINQLEIKGQDSLKKTQFIYRDSFIYFNQLLLVLLIFVPLLIYVMLKKTRKKNEKKTTNN